MPFQVPALRSLLLRCSIGAASLVVAVSPSLAQTAPQLLPYTVSVVAGGGTVVTAAGAVCPSGNTASDSYGDGCLATEIQLTGPRYGIADAAGNIFFSDYTNGLVRRVDALTGIVSAVAGGASVSPAAGAVCGANVSIDAKGDGCLATLVKLSHPVGLAFSPTGDLYFGDTGYANVRKIAATAGLVPATGGVISLADGNPGGTYGYTANNASGNVVAATGGYLDDPFGIDFDRNGNLYIADEYKEAVLVVNTNSTGSTTVNGVTIPAGTVAKVLGAATGGLSTCPNYPASPSGCNYGLFTSGASANSSLIDAPYGVAVDTAGNMYFTNEFNTNIGKVNSTGTLTNFAGQQAVTPGKVLMRGQAGSFPVGSPFGIAADPSSNVYFSDASNGVVWRVDGTTQSMYPIAGGAATVCAAATDSFGDGCPALQATFGKSGTTYASAAGAGPGVYGVRLDAAGNLYVGDTTTNLVRRISSGTQFGVVGGNQPTHSLDIHFAAGDSPATANPYSLTAGSSIFTLGGAMCTVNSDTTTDCVLPVQVTAVPTSATLGAFSGTLQVQSAIGTTALFSLTGTFVQTPVTRLGVSVVPSATCSSTIVAPNTAVTLTATIANTGGPNGTPTGTVQFFANGTAIGTPQKVVNSGATLVYTFTAVGTDLITAAYSGDSYFTASSGTSSTPVVVAAPGFTATAISNQQSTVSAGQTALYSFTLAQTVYAGTITMSCSGLPAYSSCSFSPPTITATGCSGSSVVAMSILTQQTPPYMPASFAPGGRGVRGLLLLLPGLVLALLVGLRRRGTPLRYGSVWLALLMLAASTGLVACGNGTTVPATPSGTYTVSVTATGSTGTAASFTVPLTVR